MVSHNFFISSAQNLQTSETTNQDPKIGAKIWFLHCFIPITDMLIIKAKTNQQWKKYNPVIIVQVHDYIVACLVTDRETLCLCEEEEPGK